MFTNLARRKADKRIHNTPLVDAASVKIPTCYYVASSVDGLIADSRGGVDWSRPFFDTDYGYQSFVNSIDTVVMGRRTYEHLLKTARENPYVGKRFVVLSHAWSSGPHVDLFWRGPLEGLMLRLDEMGSKSLWIVGGGSVAGAFLEAGLIDEVHQFVIPVVLGSGTALFGPLRRPAPLHFRESRSFANGVMHLRYAP
jgi:dihydrofolate reductase